jgi:hypothetical protein
MQSHALHRLNHSKQRIDCGSSPGRRIRVKMDSNSYTGLPIWRNSIVLCACMCAVVSSTQTQTQTMSCPFLCVCITSGRALRARNHLIYIYKHIWHTYTSIRRFLRAPCMFAGNEKMYKLLYFSQCARVSGCARSQRPWVFILCSCMHTYILPS